MAKCKVLFLAANPNSTERLALDEEIRAIQQLIRSSDHRDGVELISRWALRPDDLLQAMNEHQPQIVHFSGHGSSDHCLLLQADDGSPQPVTEETLQKLFEIFRNHVRLVVLNACYSLGQAKAIVQSIDCAIGMNTAVGDQAATVFSASFYRALGFGCSVEDAFAQGKVAVEMARPQATQPNRGVMFGGMKHQVGQHTIPQLITAAGKDASKIVLVSKPSDAPTTHSNRGISISGNATGGVFVTGNQNSISASNQMVISNHNESVEIRSVIATLSEVLTNLPGDAKRKIARAFEDINDELASADPDRHEVGAALDRALRFAKSSDEFANAQPKLDENIGQVIKWLGADWSKIRRHLT